MYLSDPELKARLTAQMAWEAACERLRRVLHPPPGYPATTPQELSAAFANAAERLHCFRVHYTCGADSESRVQIGNGT